MILDYNPVKQMFLLKVPRHEVLDIQVFMRDYGFDFSVPASSPSEAVFFTGEPYAAVPFYSYATSAAKAILANLQTAIEASRALDAPGLRIRCPADRELWGFQKADVSYILGRKNVLVGDEPGLGKTPIAICTANEIGAKSVLVLCPASIRTQWAARIREWTTLLWPYTIHTILTSKNGVHPHAEWTICSYDLASTPEIYAGLFERRYDLLILDECHYLKTRSARRTRAVFGGGHDPHVDGLASRAEQTICLSGTPLPNRPREAWVIGNGLCPDAFEWMSQEAFEQRFNPIEKVTVKNADGENRIIFNEKVGRHAELQARMRANFMTRHLKREVMTQLKMPVYDLIQLEETKAVKQALQAESLLDIDPEDLSGADAATLGHVAVVRRMMGLALAPQVCDYIEMLIEGGEEKLLLFGWHLEVLEIFKRRLAKYGVEIINGSTSTAGKDSAIKRFQTDPGCKVIAGNLLSLGTGTDGLQQVCSHVLIAEPSWTPGENQQAIDRLDRGGQLQQVQADIFVAPNSFAEKVLASALRKLSTTNKALDKIL